MRYFQVFLLIQISVISHSQVLNFDFEDDSLADWLQSTENHWTIDTTSSVSGKASLHHSFDNSEAGYDIISYCHEPLVFDSVITSWQFSVMYDYNPSGSNNWAFWIAEETDVKNLTPSGDASGYILGVNYKGTDDMIKVWRQDEEGTSVVLNTSFNWQESFEVGKKITLLLSRKVAGNWELTLDSNLNGKFVGLGTFVDTVVKESEQFGFYYEYTSSKDRLLWADDIIVSGAFITDTLPPQISSYELSSRNIDLKFTEDVDTNQSIRFVLNNNKQPYLVQWSTQREVTLKFSDKFLESNQLDVYNVTDIKGNVADVNTIYFDYYSVQENDVLISEIMSDPSPQIDLPNCEYVELYNRSEEPLSIKNWQFISGDRDPAYLTSHIIEKGQYLLLVDDGCEGEFAENIDVLLVDGFPALPNSGETIKLLDDEGVEIHSVAYSPELISDEEKSEGGWSLELIDANYPCIFKNNWEASESETGGTPGKENSISGTLEDYPYSTFLGASEISSEGIELEFSEPLDSVSASLSTNYFIEPYTLGISKASLQSLESSEVKLLFSENPDLQSIYTLSLSDNITDCAGTPIVSEELLFGIPQTPDSSDIIINEVMYESTDEIPEFIELYNNSQKTINLDEILFVMYDSSVDTIKKSVALVSDKTQIFPDQYIVITEDRNLLLNAYNIKASLVIEPETWISLVNDGGVIGLVDSENSCLDKAVFAPKMHFALLSNTAGVSLERIAFDVSGLEAKSWHSASSVEDFATPGRENSQTSETEIANITFDVEPKEISPDNDGYNDYVRINYTMIKEGYSCSIKIFNSDGQLEKDLVNNELVGTSGFFNWDGLDEDQSRVNMGYHILLCEAWHPDGDIIKQKKVVLVLPQK